MQPAWVFTRPQVFELFLLGIAPLLLNAAGVLGQWWDGRTWRRPVAMVATGVLFVLLSARALSLVFAVDGLPFVERGESVGAAVS
ncbi:MAG: hypothetical protein HC876_10845 [Chloroflexaceae bacterium]|nr:hypothetical protein [Chloroflexaceae bacterium]